MPYPKKNGKTHRSWSVAERRRYAGGKIAQRHVLYLGEINDSQQLAWERTLSVIDERESEARQRALFPSDRTPPTGGVHALQAFGRTQVGASAPMGRMLAGRSFVADTAPR